jgi:predicted DNA-binding protein with PD1-like motif
VKAQRIAGGASTTYVAVLDQGLRDGTTRGGHLLAGIVWPTLEVIIRQAPAELRRTHRPDVGLALIDPGARQQLPG